MRYFKQILFSLAALLLLLGCGGKSPQVQPDRKAIAERFFRGVYGGNPSIVDELAADSVFITYPVFEKFYHTPVIRGRNAVREFSAGFCDHWSDAHFTIHEAVTEGDRVVLMWTFSAINTGSELPDDHPTNQEHSWGGITLFRFNEAGKIIAEIGEESEPGPQARLAAK